MPLNIPDWGQPEQPERPLYIPTSKDWDDARDAELMELFGKGFPVKEVAAMLQRTRSSIYCRRDILRKEGKM